MARLLFVFIANDLAVNSLAVNSLANEAPY